MSYDKYRKIVDIDTFFKGWGNETVKQLTGNTKKHIYKMYVLKCIVFQRDGFKCSNKLCSNPHSPLTLHHIKFRKNNGEDHPDNAATICRSCHSGFHQGKNGLKIGKITYVTERPRPGTDWKKIKFDMRRWRKNNKHLYQDVKISWELFTILMRYLDKVYDDFDDD